MIDTKINRREFLARAATGAAGLSALGVLNRMAEAAPYLKNERLARKVVVIGIDGLDPVLLQRFIAKGEMPNFNKLMQSGHFGPLQTTMPPQSPVAWSSFITGTNPGGHGIFDFIHRDPQSFTPYLSTSRSYKPQNTFGIGKWSIPLKGGKIELLRRGPAFWTTLEENDIPTSLIKIPADFPVSACRAKVLSCMGTPDLLGTYGSFTYFTDAPVPNADKFTGGRVVNVSLADHVLRSKISGPENSFRSDGRSAEIDFTVYRDPREPIVKVVIQDKEIMLRQGEWSEWIPIKFELMPMFAGVSGMVRLFVQQVHPEFRLYMSPVNIDPMDPELPICSPSGYSRELSQAIGRFHTQGFPEDTKALSHGVFNNEEFLKQSKMVLQERLRMFDHEFAQFREGFFFFYFSSVDQNTHMMWRDMDSNHPLYEPNASPEAKGAVYYFYRKMDEVLGQVCSKIDSHSTLIVLSDHGFAPFSREFHLSTWLVENGYMVLNEPGKMTQSKYYDFVDWSKTTAYAMGLNGLYLNLFGRENHGSLMPRDAEKIKAEIIARLEQVRDPLNGRKIITKAYDSHKIYSGPYLELAPDIVVGYQSGYRISDEAALGKFPQGIIGDRKDKWSADHCMDPQVVPGVLLTNRQVSSAQPGLWDLAPTILREFGLDVPREMDGKPIFKI
jgi:predicted AlkP superfamily phosphohydrolase/phosphomutase